MLAFLECGSGAADGAPAAVAFVEVESVVELAAFQTGLFAMTGPAERLALEEFDGPFGFGQSPDSVVSFGGFVSGWDDVIEFEVIP